MKLFVSIILIWIGFLGWIQKTDQAYLNTRTALLKQRALNHSKLKSAIKLAIKKHRYFEQAFSECKTQDLGHVALKMNELEREYNIPYKWGGSINSLKFPQVNGLDCSGFIHGLLYYNGEISRYKRLTTDNLMNHLCKRKKYIVIYNSKLNSRPFNSRALKTNDIILWPKELKNNRKDIKINGHVGIVSKFVGSVAYVTHCGKHTDDKIGVKGEGINTIRADRFIKNKKRGSLYIIRKNSDAF